MYGRSYVANTSSCDGKSAFLNEKPQHDHVNFFQSFAHLREPGLPTKLPAEKEAATRRDSGVLALESEIAQLRRDNACVNDKRLARSKLQTLLKKLKRDQLRQHQHEWVENRRKWHVTTRGKERPDDDTQTDLSDILCVIMPERGRLARTMISNEVVSADERKQAVKDLHSLVSQDCTVIYRPQERPIDDVCPREGCG